MQDTRYRHHASTNRRESSAGDDLDTGGMRDEDVIVTREAITQDRRVRKPSVSAQQLPLAAAEHVR